jgi:hypothetical protein
MISWDSDARPERDPEPRGEADSAAEPEAVELLRSVWSARGQSAADLEDALGPQKSCKNMQNVGFEGLAGSDGDMQSAWRATLERDGKLSREAGSVGDLVLGQAESQRP